MNENYIGKALRAMREKAGYSIEKLAEFFGGNKEIISDWESGRSEPELSQLLILSGLYGTSVDDMVEVSAEDLVDESVREKYKHESWLNKLSCKYSCC